MHDLTEWNKMIAGELYLDRDPYLTSLREKAHAACRRYNRDPQEGMAELRALMGGAEEFYIEPDFFCDYLANFYVGRFFYANTGLVVLDTCPVTIGDHVMVGPQVGIYTATHPLDFRLRRPGPDYGEYGKPVTIGDDVWIGGHAVINPGVTIGSRSVVASGAVVTKDVPDDVAVGGNPARIIKRLGEME